MTTLCVVELGSAQGNVSVEYVLCVEVAPSAHFARYGGRISVLESCWFQVFGISVVELFSVEEIFSVK